VFLSRSRLGQAIRATAQNSRAARIMGIDTNHVYAMTFGLNAAICGTAGTDSWVPQPSGLRPERNMLVSRLRMQGFLCFDYAGRYGDAHADLAKWVGEGKIRYREDVAEGLENAPAALAGLYQGRNMGRQLIRVRPDPFA
ncbi:MAG: hypothetical protein VW881_03205, partial [Alphaproteobacteria bacterium]